MTSPGAVMDLPNCTGRVAASNFVPVHGCNLAKLAAADRVTRENGSSMDGQHHWYVKGCRMPLATAVFLGAVDLARRVKMVMATRIKI